jgi:hypothetical protein
VRQAHWPGSICPRQTYRQRLSAGQCDALITGGIGFSPGTRNNVPALSMSA